MFEKIKASFNNFIGRYYAPMSIRNVFTMLLINLALNLILFLMPLLFKPSALKFYLFSFAGITNLLVIYASPILLAFFAFGLYKGSSISFYAIGLITGISLLLSLGRGFAGGLGIFSLLFYGLILYSLSQPESRRYCNIKIGF